MHHQINAIGYILLNKIFIFEVFSYSNIYSKPKSMRFFPFNMVLMFFLTKLVCDVRRLLHLTDTSNLLHLNVLVKLVTQKTVILI